ncbi:hypothetical protein [Rubrivirga marina]|uniref:DUF429 domain-containing protein n=1 Tax=Rubrivirga marina TaxID=1196024 RepID=A0A271IWZ9_9BACT|nr:hypothetical protein [Rubrivirga marina]PAP75712.1 hypothetical protein BSZ37_04300 [Rubrivirga marina]
MPDQPALLVHADWSTAARKRTMAVARRAGDVYHVAAPEPVGDLGTFWDRLRDRSDGGRALVGFDFPIGLPAAYARAAGIDDFRSVLPDLGRGDWAAFYDLATVPDEIDLRRPFYPGGTGTGTRRTDLTDALGVGSFDALRRRCEQATPTRGSASPLFWTVGGQQVGRAAIAGWRDLLAPALRRDPGALALWPFDGDLSDLLAGDVPVVAETYPAEAGLHVGLPPPGRGWSKRRRDGRCAQGPALFRWAACRPVVFSSQLCALIEDGFGEAATGEDAFDAAVGLFGMIEVVLGHRPPGAPGAPDVRGVEGWILGQSPDA